jgi:prepilin-type processing-associated H-X9-DG protein
MSPTVHFRHNYKTNIAWADGHVTATKIPDDYDDIDAYLERFREWQLGMVDPVDNSLFDLK